MMGKLVFLLVFIGCLHFGSSSLFTGTWAPTQNTMSSRRSQCALLMLNNGKALVCGGYGNITVAVTCDLYDPATNSFTLVGTMHDQRGCPAYALLNDGRVFLGGGQNSSNSLSSAEIFNPVDNSFTRVSDMPIATYCPTTFTLPSGLVLITGGYNDFGWQNYGFLYNATNDSYGTPVSMAFGYKYMGAAAWLPALKQLAVIGYDIDIYDPMNNTWRFSQNQDNNIGYEQGINAFTLSDGKVAIFGGWNGGDSVSNVTIWDPVIDNFTVAGNLLAYTSYNAAALLPNDNILIAGGLSNQSSQDFATNAAEIWQRSLLGSQLIQPMSTRRQFTNGIAIGVNKMLVVGGQDDTGISLNTAEVVTISSGTTGVPATTGVHATTGAQVTSSKGTSASATSATSSKGTSASATSAKGTSGSTSTVSGTSSQATGSHVSSASHFEICASLLFAISLLLI